MRGKPVGRTISAEDHMLHLGISNLRIGSRPPYEQTFMNGIPHQHDTFRIESIRLVAIVFSIVVDTDMPKKERHIPLTLSVLTRAETMLPGVGRPTV